MKEGTSVDPAKVEASLNCHAPTCVAKVQSFLDMIGYYGRFSKIF